MEILEKKTELSASFRRAVDEIPTLSREDHEFRTYRLGFPNREVEEGFVKYLVPFYGTD
jgi:hypothetical protein